MSINPFAVVARAFFGPFKSAILASWEAAKQAAFAEIRESLPKDDAIAEAKAELERLTAGESSSIEDAPEEEPERKRRGKRSES